MLKIEDTGALQREKQRVAAWDQLTELREHLYGAATRQMLAVADLQLGDQVLDIAAGTGDRGGKRAAGRCFLIGRWALFGSRLQQAGLQGVQVQVIPLTFHFPSFEVLTAWWGSSWKKALAKLDSEPRRYLLEEARQAVHQFEEPQGMSAPAEVLLGVGTKEERAPLKQEKEID